MAIVVYIFCAICVVMVLGWAVYVLPVPGPMSAWELTGAFLPALLMLAGAIGVLLVFAALFRIAEIGLAAVQRRRR